MTTLLADVKFRPTPPASVDMRNRKTPCFGSLKRSQISRPLVRVSKHWAVVSLALTLGRVDFAVQSDHVVAD